MEGLGPVGRVWSTLGSGTQGPGGMKEVVTRWLGWWAGSRGPSVLLEPRGQSQSGQGDKPVTDKEAHTSHHVACHRGWLSPCKGAGTQRLKFSVVAVTQTPGKQVREVCLPPAYSEGFVLRFHIPESPWGAGTEQAPTHNFHAKGAAFLFPLPL